MFVWLMNLAALYHKCSVEKTLMLLDYKMHLYLKPEEMNDWAKHFNNSEDFQQESEHQLFRIAAASSSLISAQVEMVIKWFINGLQGPFGGVGGIKTKNLATLGHFINPSFYPTNIVPPPTSFAIQQNDTWNC